MQQGFVILLLLKFIMRKITCFRPFKFHTKNIDSKIGVKNRIQAAWQAGKTDYYKKNQGKSLGSF